MAQSTRELINWQEETLETLHEDEYHVCDWWAKERYFDPDEIGLGERDERTASLVMRDGDQEIVAEGQLCEFSGLYALVRVKNVPEDLPKRGEPPAVPSDFEWVHRDSPMEHHVEAVRCSRCGEEKQLFEPGMAKPKARREPWEEIRHRPGCPHATESDKQYHAELRLADIISARNPRSMTNGALWRESEWLGDVYKSDEMGYLTDAVHQRYAAIHRTLEARLDPRYPACPECDETDWRLTEHARPEECGSCWAVPDQETADEYIEQRRRIWGWRGHGSRIRGGDA